VVEISPHDNGISLTFYTKRLLQAIPLSTAHKNYTYIRAGRLIRWSDESVGTGSIDKTTPGYKWWLHSAIANMKDFCADVEHGVAALGKLVIVRKTGRNTLALLSMSKNADV